MAASCLGLTGACAWAADATIHIDVWNNKGRISPLLYGGNVPGWDHIEYEQRAQEAIQALHPRFLRYPCGMVSDLYHWEYAVGPTRQTNVLVCNYTPHRKKLCDSSFGTDEFMHYLDQLKARPIFTVNAGSGTALEAANWVEYCNGDATTPYGSLRVKHGHTDPYNVKYWEIGNQLYLDWHPFHMEPDAYSDLFIHYSQLMKEKDPSIRIGISGHPRKKYYEWTQEVLQQAGNFADFISFHYYYPFTAGNNLDKDSYVKAVLAAPLLIERELSDIKNSPLVSQNNLDIFVTEYNTQYDTDATTSHNPMEIRDLKSALSLANLMMVFIRQGIKAANIWDIYSNSYFPLLKWVNGELRRSPSYYVFYLFGDDFGEYLLPTKYTGEFINAPDISNTSQTVKMQSLYTVAAMDSRFEKLYLMVVNNENREVTAKLYTPAFQPATKMTVWTLTGATPYATNDGPEQLINLKAEQRKTTQQITFPPFSLTKIKIASKP